MMDAFEEAGTTLVVLQTHALKVGGGEGDVCGGRVLAANADELRRPECRRAAQAPHLGHCAYAPHLSHRAHAPYLRLRAHAPHLSHCAHAPHLSHRAHAPHLSHNVPATVPQP
eukprot:359013-Chlamydomonas_euryale.AAC.12